MTNTTNSVKLLGKEIEDIIYGYKNQNRFFVFQSYPWEGNEDREHRDIIIRDKVTQKYFRFTEEREFESSNRVEYATVQSRLYELVEVEKIPAKTFIWRMVQW